MRIVFDARAFRINTNGIITNFVKICYRKNENFTDFFSTILFVRKLIPHTASDLLI